MTKRALRRKRRIDAILESAVAAFRQNGYHGTSMEQIADQLLMTKGSLYYYFRDKEEILYAIHEQALDRILEGLARAQKGSGCPCERLETLLASHIRVMVEGFQGTALALEFGALSPQRFARVVSKRDRYERAIRTLIAQGASQGCFRPVDPKLAGMAVLGSINWIARWHRSDGPAGPEEVARQFVDVFMNGLLVRSAASHAAPHRRFRASAPSIRSRKAAVLPRMRRRA